MCGGNTVNTNGVAYGGKEKNMETLNRSDPTNMPHPASEKSSNRRAEGAALTDLLLTDHPARREADS